MEGKIKILHVITRMEEGGAPRVLLALLDGMDRGEFVQSLAAGSGAPGSDLLNCGKDIGLAVHEIKTFTREISPIRDLQSLYFLIALMKRNRYDIIHTHTSKAGFLGRLSGRLVGHRRIIYSPHGNIFEGYFPGWETKLYTLAERAAARWCEKIVTLSDAGSHEFLKRGIGVEEQYKSIYNGIDIDGFVSGADGRDIRLELGLGTDDLVIICVGRLVSIKGYDVLIQASPDIIKGIGSKRIHFLMVGEGPLKGELMEEAEAIGVGEHFTFLGFRDDVARLLSISDLLVMPSINEGLGMSIVEAMAKSVPVVASKVGGIVEVVDDGVTGFLVPPSSPADLAKRCVEILRNKTLAKKMGIAGRERAGLLFDIKSTVKNTEKLYRILMSKSNGGY